MREEAMIWWNKLTPTQKNTICEVEGNPISKKRKWQSLTGREIEALFIEKCNSIIKTALEEELPSFLYREGDDILVGVQGDTNVTEEWNKFLKRND